MPDQETKEDLAKGKEGAFVVEDRMGQTGSLVYRWWDGRSRTSSVTDGLLTDALRKAARR